jgi:hypothetical protein
MQQKSPTLPFPETTTVNFLVNKNLTLFSICEQTHNLFQRQRVVRVSARTSASLTLSTAWTAFHIICYICTTTSMAAADGEGAWIVSLSFAHSSGPSRSCIWWWLAKSWGCARYHMTKGRESVFLLISLQLLLFCT